MRTVATMAKACFCVFGLVLVALGCSSAEAMTIDPQCAKVGDKIACTCALQYGGQITKDGHTFSPPTPNRKRYLPAYVDCIDAAKKQTQ